MLLSDYWSPHLERCGFMLQDGSIVEVLNCHEDTQAGFRISPEDILKYETQVAATWHTHPYTGTNLSIADYKCFLAWPEWQHIIVHKEDLALYYVEQNRVLRYDGSDLPRLLERSLPQRTA